MVSKISDETEIQAPAAKVWELYGTLELAKFVPVHLPNLVQKIEVLEGDGGEGTLFLLTFAPGKSITLSTFEYCIYLVLVVTIPKKKMLLWYMSTNLVSYHITLVRI